MSIWYWECIGKEELETWYNMRLAFRSDPFDVLKELAYEFQPSMVKRGFIKSNSGYSPAQINSLSQIIHKRFG